MKKLLTVFCLFLLCSCTHQKPLFNNKEDLKIIVASDLHYYDPSLFKDCSWFNGAWEYEDGQMIHYTHLFVENFISEVISQKPDMVLISGDLTYNGEKVSHESLSKQLQRLTDAQIQVAVINGNHDVNNGRSLAYDEQGAYGIEDIDVETYKQLYANFGLNQAYSKDKESLSYALHLNNTYDLLVIDTCRDTSYMTASDLKESTMKWIEKELKSTQSNNKKTLVMMHHNLGIHCEAIYTSYVLENADEMQDLFAQYDVPVVFSGHIHTQHTKQINNTTEIVTSALSIAPVQYGIVELNNDTLHYKTQEIESVTGDEAFFKVTSYNKSYNNFEKNFGSELAHELASYMATVNLTYFTGNTYAYRDEFMQNPLLEVINNPSDDIDFHSKYLESILSETINHQEIIIDMK